MTTGSQDWSRWYPIVDEKLRARGIDVSTERASTKSAAVAAAPRRRARRYTIAFAMMTITIGIILIRLVTH